MNFVQNSVQTFGGFTIPQDLRLDTTLVVIHSKAARCGLPVVGLEKRIMAECVRHPFYRGGVFSPIVPNQRIRLTQPKCHTWRTNHESNAPLPQCAAALAAGLELETGNSISGWFCDHNGVAAIVYTQGSEVVKFDITGPVTGEQAATLMGLAASRFTAAPTQAEARH